MKQAIGGYFELELQTGEPYHRYAIALNTARNCFEYILLARKYKKVYIPYYTCEVMLQPLERNHIAYEFYSVDNHLQPKDRIILSSDEAFLYTNYYGLKQSCVEQLAFVYGSQLIVDNAQAFYAPRVTGIDTFYSPRKFFGVPDGGYLYTDAVMNHSIHRDISYTRTSHLLHRIDEGAEAGYVSFRENDDALDNQSIRRMSNLTERILEGVDYELVKERRRKNFLYLHESLGNTNLLEWKLLPNDVPMVYPYMTGDVTLRKRLIENQIFVATYWNNVKDWCSPDMFENNLCQHVIPLPIDQRYTAENMDRIIDIIDSK